MKNSLVFLFWFSILLSSQLKAGPNSVPIDVPKDDTKSIVKRMFETGHVKIEMEVWPVLIGTTVNYYLKLDVKIPLKDVGKYFSQPSYQLDTFNPEYQLDETNGASKTKRELSIATKDSNTTFQLETNSSREGDLIINSQAWLDGLNDSFSIVFKKLNMLRFEIGNIQFIEDALLSSDRGDNEINHLELSVVGLLDEDSEVFYSYSNKKQKEELEIRLEDNLIKLSSLLVDSFERDSLITTSGSSVKEKSVSVDFVGKASLHEISNPPASSFEESVTHEKWKIKSKLEYCFVPESDCHF